MNQESELDGAAFECGENRPTVCAIIRHCEGRVDFRDDLPARLTDRTAEVMGLMARCRRGELGAKQLHCDRCGDQQVKLKSCGDRHCPTCGGRKRHLWHEKVTQWALPCDYLHCVTTLPHELNDLIAANPELLLRLLMVAARKSIQKFAKQYFGIDQVGVVFVLHTWGQRLNRHYHVHIILTAGGLNKQRTLWLPIDVDQAEGMRPELAELFQDIFLKGLMDLIGKGGLRLPTSMLDSTSSVTQVLQRHHDRVQSYPWIADIQGRDPNQQSGTPLISYVSRYVRGIAIGNRRLISWKDGFVVFDARDYRDNTDTTLRLHETEFVKRISYHVLPYRVPRIGYGGFYHNKVREDRLELCRRLIGVDCTESTATTVALPFSLEEDEEPLPESYHTCRKCDRPMTEGDHLDGTLTTESLAIVGWMIAMLETIEVGSLGECLRRVVAEQTRAGTKNSIISGLSNGMINLPDPIIGWVMLLLDQRMNELAEVPLEDASPRGPPQSELIPC
ncbi:MAG: transposase [Planctomycetales bacterium]|nr:transposase [Planctomycetales bacterium]